MFFWKKKKKQKTVDVMETAEAVVTELQVEEPSEKKYYVVELCEQIIDASREFEDAKSEYQLVTSYLNDVQLLEDMSDEQKAAIIEIARHISKLNAERSEYLKTEAKISDAQFLQMQEEEDQMPRIIKRFAANETYLTTIKRDMQYLEGEKLEWQVLRQDSQRVQEKLRTLSICVAMATGVVAFLLIAAHVVWQVDTQFFTILTAFLATLFGAVILLKFQNCEREIKRCDVNRNHAITLENHVKVKFVNIKNAIDYSCEKYHVKNSEELHSIFEEYQEAVRKRERFRKNNDDLEYYNRELIRRLERYHLYDAKVWVNYANAIVDKKEMVEVKHNLIVRRQKLRSRMEYNLEAITNLKKDIEQNMGQLGERAGQVREILTRIDQLHNMN